MKSKLKTLDLGLFFFGGLVSAIRNNSMPNNKTIDAIFCFSILVLSMYLIYAYKKKLYYPLEDHMKERLLRIALFAAPSILFLFLN